MAKACEIADREKLDMFVEANEFAESFYHRNGFNTEQKTRDARWTDRVLSRPPI
jgi:hypothetical protein